MAKSTMAAPLHVESRLFQNGYDVMIDDLSFAHDWNYAYNRAYENSIVYSDGYITDQYAYPFTKMRYGVTTMDGVACELIAIYNALNKVGYHTTLSEIANYYEHNRGMWLNGTWGTKYKYLDDYFANIECVKVTEYGGSGNVDDPYFRSMLSSVFEHMDTDSAIILSVINKGGLKNRIHTFTAIKTDDGIIRFYNSYNTKIEPYLDKESIDQFITERDVPNVLSVYKIERKK